MLYGEPEDEIILYAHVPFIYRLGSHFLMKQYYLILTSNQFLTLINSIG